MKISEVRIGNFVHWKVTGIMAIELEDFEFCYRKNKDQLDCTPIPLSLDWLNKFGFENGLQHVDGLGSIWYEWDIEDQCIYIKDDGGEIQAYHQIKFVHQLQNVFFALNGEELTIK